MRQEVINALEHLEAADREVQAFVPEPRRQQRVLGEFDDTGEQVNDSAPPDLFGVMIGIKDIINVDGLPTLAGSELPASLFDGPEATMVRRLRGAGALIAGKTVTTEFAFSEPGPTRNPRNHAHTPGGSSSGSAAAVAVGLVPLAIGTQTVDSVITPASYCGVVGFKPSFGRVPLDGVIPFSPSMDHAGLLAVDVGTVSRGASAICDAWRDVDIRSDLVLGVPDFSYVDLADSEAVSIFEASLDALRARGYPIVETSLLSDIDSIISTHRRLNAVEFAGVHADWFSRHGDRYRPRTARLFAEGVALPESAIREGQESGEVLRRALEDEMDRHGITAWISPAATGSAPRGLDYIGDPTMAVPWTHAHLPVVGLPAGETSDGLPLGIQLTGRFNGDEELLDLATSVEEAPRRSAGVTGSP
jgi:Asp-tRNA(Asn)/Glu-tRNA(Gln) amidotransferase A subunit family amidase